jgi:uncharacterized protein YegP (UPF0339 family)
MKGRRAAAQLGLPELEWIELDLLRRKLALVVRQVERAARGAPERSATRAARKLLRLLSETKVRRGPMKRRAHFEIYPDAAGEYRWRLRSSNGRIIADGAEGYSSRAACRRGLALVRRFATLATTRELD